MFGLFKSKPPMNAWETAWTENCMAWYVDQFGEQRMRQTPTLVPDYEDLPALGSHQDLDVLRDFVGTWMGVDCACVQWQVYADVVDPDSVVIQDKQEASVIVPVTEEDLQNRDAVIATLARECAWLAFQRLNLPEDQVRQLTTWHIELLPAFLGLGIFSANTTLQAKDYIVPGGSSWSVPSRGELPSRIIGYAQALRETARESDDHSWSVLLRQDAEVTFSEGKRYLTKSQDSAFKLGAVDPPLKDLATNAILEGLRTGGPSKKILMLWELIKRRPEIESLQEPDRLVSDAIRDWLRHKDPGVRAAAVSTLACYDLSVDAAQDLTDALKDGSKDVRINAAQVLPRYVGVADDFVVEELKSALQDDVRAVVFSVVQALTAFGPAAEPAIKMLLKRLRQNLVECRDEQSVTILKAIQTIVPDSRSRLQDFFGESDSEYLTFAESMLDEMSQESNTD